MIRRYSILIFIILAALSIRCINITLPWIRFGDTDGAVYGHYAKNAVRYGNIETKFGPCSNSGPVVNGNYSYYINHPLSLFIFLISISYRIFGIHEWSTRLVPILFSIGSLLTFYLIVQMLWDKRTGVIATLLFGFNPLTAYWDSTIWTNTMVMFFIFAMIYFYFHWINKAGKIYFIIMITFQVLGLLSHWAAYLMAPLLLIHCFFCERNKSGWMIIPVLVNIVFFSMHLFYIQWLRPESALSAFWNAFVLRSGNQGFAITWLEYSYQVTYWLIQWYTFPLCIFSAIWLFSFFRNLNKKGLKEDIFLISFFLWGSLFIILFREVVYAHSGTFYLYFFAPFFALSGALGLLFIQDSILPIIISKYSGKKIFWSLNFIAVLCCIFLVFHRSENPDIGRYSWFFFKFYLICIGLTLGLILFTLRMSNVSLQRLLKHGYSVVLFLLFLFVAQSIYVIYGLHQKRGMEFNYVLAKAINENTEFEDAVITPLNPLYYYIPYYADRYVELNVRTKEEFFKVLDTEERSFKYYITSNRELIRKNFSNSVIELFPQYSSVSPETMFKRFEYYGIKETPCELDVFISNNYTGRAVGPWIIYDLSKGKLSL